MQRSAKKGYGTDMKLSRDSQSGFTIMGLLSALLVVTFLVAIVGGIIYAFYNTGRTTSLDGDIRDVQRAANDYFAASSQAGQPSWPTMNGTLPQSGAYAPINFVAGFGDTSGKTVRFYPDFLKALPRHWNLAGVWLIDSRAQVSADMKGEEY
jgi:type II secretory pathway pseudopilin PulG